MEIVKTRIMQLPSGGFCVTLGDSIIGIGSENRFVFSSPAELRSELRKHGLFVHKGTVCKERRKKQRRNRIEHK